jgi:hypothetical protein
LLARCCLKAHGRPTARACSNSACGGHYSARAPAQWIDINRAVSSATGMGSRTVDSGMTGPALYSKNPIIEDGAWSSNIVPRKIFKHSINSPELCKFIRQNGSGMSRSAYINTEAAPWSSALCFPQKTEDDDFVINRQYRTFMVVFQPRIHASRQMHDFSLTKRKESKHVRTRERRTATPDPRADTIAIRHPWPAPRLVATNASSLRSPFARTVSRQRDRDWHVPPASHSAKGQGRTHSLYRAYIGSLPHICTSQFGPCWNPDAWHAC